MSAVYEGSTATQWVELLQTGEIHERCAAALALAELGPNAPPAKDALLAALHDAETAVQVAAQVAIGFIDTPAENRRRMFDYLLGEDEEKQRDTLAALDGLAYNALQEIASKPEEAPTAVADSIPQPARPSIRALAPPPTGEVPDVAVVTVLPWWFLDTGVALTFGLAWMLRGVYWSKWPMALLAAAAGLYFFYSWTRRQNGTLSVKRLRARGRLAWAVILAGTCGFAIGQYLPLGAVLIDNESGENVRLLLGDKEWLTIATGESKKASLPPGTYRLTVQTEQGNRVLDAHEINVSAHQLFILNVLGGQVYFEGIVQYGINGGSMKVVRTKWFQVPEVDYLFRNPPEVIFSAHPVNKSYFTKGAPPIGPRDP